MPTYMQVLTDIVAAVITVALVIALMRQCRKPTWLPGRLILWSMNRRHSSVTDWGLAQVAMQKQFTILDVGCGGGRTIQKLSSLASEGTVYGIDYSGTCVAAALRTNRQAIEAGLVNVLQGSVSHLPFRDGMFDAASAIETHYYWPNPTADLREILRALKPGGTLAIIAETYKGRRFDVIYRLAMLLLRATYLSVNEHRELFTSAGFVDVMVMEQRNKGWICASGKKPAAT